MGFLSSAITALVAVSLGPPTLETTVLNEAPKHSHCKHHGSTESVALIPVLISFTLPSVLPFLPYPPSMSVVCCQVKKLPN